MPVTVNGIGTHYYGRQNLQVRHGPCRSCGRVGELASYDTGLWFVVIFIPVIPLGRKRILDECPSCRRHYVASAAEYARNCELAMSAARETYDRQRTVAAALEAHGLMLGYHRHDEADAFREQVLAQFPRDAGLRCGFADHLQQMLRYDESVPLYEQAYRLQPDLPGARIGMAYVRMNERRLDEARKLLDFLMKPGAGQQYPLAALETLAKLYQQNGEHDEALELFRHLLEEYPDAAQNHAVRKMIRVSERKAGTFERVLPERTGSGLAVLNPWSQQFSPVQRAFAMGVLLMAVAAVGAFASTEYIRRHRTLHILSGLEKPVTVQLDNLPPIAIGAHQRFTVSEGPHRVSVTGAVTAQYDLRLESPLWSRPFRNPVWVVNVAGTAGLVHAQYRYAQNPVPPAITVLTGQTVLAWPHIDYPFIQPPQQMQLSNRNQVVTKSGLVTVPPEPRVQVGYIADPQQALDYMEAFLPLRPQDGLLFWTYQESVKQQGAMPRAEAFLKPGLERRPVEMNWHRTFQNLLEVRERESEVTAFYDAALAKEPDNGDLIYLRSRIELDPEQSLSLIERARKAAPNSPWPWYSLGYRAMCRGDWPEALEAISKAKELGFDLEMLRPTFSWLQLGAGEGEAVVATARAQLQQDPTDIAALAILLDALVGLQQPDAARQELEAWTARNSSAGGNPSAMAHVFRVSLYYQVGDFESLGASVEPFMVPTLQSLRTAYWLATGQPDKLANASAILKEPWDVLSLAVAFQSVGNDAEAATWRQRACDQLGAGGPHERQAAEWLAGDSAPDFAKIEQFTLDPRNKLIFLCALGQRFAELHGQAAELAWKLNVSHAPPYHLVARVFPREP